MKEPFDVALILNKEFAKLRNELQKLRNAKFLLQKKDISGADDKVKTKLQEEIRIKEVEIQESNNKLTNLRVNSGLLKGAYIESEAQTNVFQAQGEIFKLNDQQIRIEWLNNGWVKE